MILVPFLVVLAVWSFAVFAKVVYRLAVASGAMRGTWDALTAGFFAGRRQGVYAFSTWDGGPRYKGVTLGSRATAALGGYALTTAALSSLLALILIRA